MNSGMLLVERSETNNVQEVIKLRKCTFYWLISDFPSSKEYLEEKQTRILDIQCTLLLLSHVLIFPDNKTDEQL